MKKVLAVAVGVGLLCAVVRMVWAQEESTMRRMEGVKPGVVAEDVSTITAKVKKINHKTREVTLLTDEGKTFDIVADERVKNLKQVKKGDVVTVQYKRSVALYVREAEEGGPSAVAGGGMQTAKSGEKPAVSGAATARIVSVVEDVDYAKRTVTIRGPEGDTRVITCDERVQRFNEIQKGDELVLDVVEALAISVEKPEKK